MLKAAESIIYILSNIFLFISFLRYKKNDSKINLVHWIFITFILLFCYNSLMALVLSTLNIPVYLISMTSINTIFGIILTIKSRKKIQKYFVEKKDLIAIIVLAVISLCLMVARFHIPFNIAYETCDPGIHYWTARDFYEQSFLLNKVTDKTVVNFETRQAASYTNVGLIFKTISPWIHDFDFYIFYILFDVWMLFMAGMIFYILISNTKTKSKFALSLISSILYFTGYPLNNMLFGFFYSGHAITIICTLLILIKIYENKDYSKKQMILLISLLCFGLFFTYYFFAPVIFIAMFIYMTYKDIKNKENIISKKFIIKNLIIFLPACLLGFLYYIVPNLGDANTSISTQINLDGYFYNNIYSNFTMLIPLIVLSFIDAIKTKKPKLEHIILTLLLGFMAIILILIIQDKAVGYYLSKNYYLLWLIIFAISAKFVIKMYDKHKIPIITYGLTILIVIITTIADVENKMVDLEDWDVNIHTATTSRVFDVYRYNYELIMFESPEFTADEMKMLKTIYKMGARDIQHNSSYGYVNRRAWFAAYFRKTPITETTENKLFTYLTLNDFIEIVYSYKTEYEYNPKNVNYNVIYNSSYNWFLLIYNKEVDVPLILDPDTEVEVVIEGKENYDLIDRGTCPTCKFYDFEEGLLIYKGNEY